MARSDPQSTVEADPAAPDAPPARSSGSERSARERILRAACDLIAEQGLGSARIAQIARAAGVSTALVHYHFRTRDALLSETLDYAWEQTSAVRLRPPEEESGSAARRLAEGIERSLPTTEPARREWQLWIELWLGVTRDPALRPVVAQMYARYRAWIADAIAEGAETGEFAAVDPGSIADLTMALIDGLGLRVLAGDPAMRAERARERIGEILARELEVPAGQLPFPVGPPS